YVGQCGPVAAEAVTDRTRPRAGACRTDGRTAGLGIDRDNASAAGADRLQVDFRCDVVIPVDHRFAGIFEPAVLNHGDLEGGAAHIRGDGVGVAQNVGEIAGT